MNQRRSKKINKRAVARNKSKRQILFFARKYWRILILFSLTSVFGGGVYYIGFTSGTFTINEIEVQGAYDFVSATDLYNLLRTNQTGKNILLVNSTTLEGELENVFLGAKKISVHKVFPDKIKVIITERIPLATLSNDYSDGEFMVDREGYILGIVSPEYEDLPKIRYDGDLKIGSFVNRDLIPVYYELIEAFSAANINASSVSYHDKYITFFIPPGTKVSVGNEKNKKEALSVLSRLIHNISLSGKSPSFIDLRYDKVVVSYKD